LLGGIVLFEIVFYRDKNGKEPVLEYIEGLASRRDKSGGINLRKILEYIKVLRAYGTQAGEPYIKHLDGEIWELRPIRERVLFAAWTEKEFILLHHFFKKTQKTPTSEIEQAKRRLEDYRERDRLIREAEDTAGAQEQTKGAQDDETRGN
jgi:phage-related protein